MTTAAPYRHFADRDELLAAVAARALGVFAAMLTAAADTADTPAQRLAAMGRAARWRCRRAVLGWRGG